MSIVTGRIRDSGKVRPVVEWRYWAPGQQQQEEEQQPPLCPNFHVLLPLKMQKCRHCQPPLLEYAAADKFAALTAKSTRAG